MVLPWLHNGQPFYMTYDQILANHHHSFIYRIDNTVNGRSYIGKKCFHTRRRNRGRRVPHRNGVFQSTWQLYWGSCDALEKDLYQFGHEKFTRNLLSLHPDSRTTTYAEEELMFKLDVLRAKLPSGEFAYYNGSIAGRFF